MADRIYVIEHVNPDTDTVAAAMGYAWLLRERDGSDTFAARAGAVNPQTALDFAMLMVTGVVNGSSRLLLTDEPPQLSDLPYPPHRRTGRVSPKARSRAKSNYCRSSWDYWKGKQ